MSLRTSLLGLACALFALLVVSSAVFGQPPGGDAEAQPPAGADNQLSGNQPSPDADGQDSNDQSSQEKQLSDFEKAIAARLEKVEAGVSDAADVGHNSWMMTSSALVLFMTVPGLAMFYCGLVRRKNVLSVIMQCIFLMCLMTVIWAVLGYSLSFGGADPYIGTTEYAFMNGVQRTWNETTGAADTPEMPAPFYAIPRLTHMLFQGMFFIITPALICGAFAERMKFSSMVVFSILWGLIVYCPLAHWVWGGGILAYGGENSWAGGALDFAGGTVVHISSGVSALICAIVLGKRLGFGHEDMRPHNLTYTVIGAGMLWVGWFGFNAGSAIGADGIAASAFAATHFAAAAAGITWAVIEWLVRGKPSALGVATGVVAGLVCITPASGHVQPIWGIVFGIAASAICYLACTKLKATFKYDDSLDAFGVHGIGGTLGAILTGVFATRAIWDLNKGEPMGLIEGGGALLGQIVAVLVTWVFAAVLTFLILKAIDATIGLRVSKEEEQRGLDVSEHEEEGYILV